MHKTLLLNCFNVLSQRSSLFLKSFQSMGHETKVINWARKANWDQPAENTIKLPISGKFHQFIGTLPFLYFKIWNLVRHDKFSHIYCNHPILLPIAIILSKKHKAYVTYDIPEFYLENLKIKLTKRFYFITYIIKKAEIFFLKHIDVVFTIDSHNSFLHSYYQPYVKFTLTLNNVPSIQQYSSFLVRKVDNQYNRRPTILYIGGLSTENGINVILNVAKKLQIAGSNYLFLLIGNFNSVYKESEFLAYIEHHQLHETVKHISWIPYAELFSYLSIAKVGLCLYQRNLLYEQVGKTNSRKLFTYMHAGLPIVGPNFGSQGKCIEEENCGLTVDTSDIEQVANAINYLLANPDDAKKMGNNGKNAIIKKYNWELEQQKIINVFNKLNKMQNLHLENDQKDKAIF